MSKTPADRQQKGGYAAPIVIDTAANIERVAKAKRVGIFEIDGVTYDMPAAARAEIALEYLDLLDQGDEDGASFYLISEALGRDAYVALKSVKGLTDEQFEGILVRVQAIALPKGTQPSSTRASGRG